MKFNSIFTFIYAAFVFIGGIIGYATAGSLASLAMGTLFGALLALCGNLMLKGKQYAYVTTIVISLVLLTFFAHRFIVTGKFMPAGLMVVLSLITASALLSSCPKSVK